MDPFPRVPLGSPGMTVVVSAFDLREVGDLVRGLDDLRQQFQPVLAQRLVVGVDGDLVEETVDGRAQFRHRRPWRRRSLRC